MNRLAFVIPLLACVAIACSTETPVTVLVEVTREIEVTRQVPVAGNADDPLDHGPEPPRPFALCEDYRYMVFLVRVESIFWDAREVVARSEDDRDSARRNGEFKRLESDAMFANGSSICGEEIADQALRLNIMGSPEGRGICARSLLNIVNHATPASRWSDVALDERVAVKSWLEGIVNYCHSGSTGFLRYQPLLSELLN